MPGPAKSLTLARIGVGCALLALASCGGPSSPPVGGGGGTPAPSPTPTPPPQPIVSVTSQQIAAFAAPWSMVFLTDGHILVTERPFTPVTLLNPIESGRLRLVTQAGAVSDPIPGLP